MKKSLVILYFLLLTTLVTEAQRNSYLRYLSATDEETLLFGEHKYIDPENYQNIPVHKVKCLIYYMTNKQKLPETIKRFTQTEILSIYTRKVGKHVRWANGGCEFFGYYKKGKLKQLPQWLTRLKQLKELCLYSQTRLRLKPTLRLLAQLKNLQTLTIEVSKKDLKHLTKIKNLKKLKSLTIQIEELTPQKEKKVRARLRNIPNLKITLKNIQHKMY